MSRVVADLEPLLAAELEKMEAVESEAGGLPVPVEIEGAAGGGGHSLLAGGGGDEEGLGGAAATAAAAGDSKSESFQGGAGGGGGGRQVEDSYVDEDEYPADDDDEDEDDYRSAPSITSGPKKPPARNSFWGWMEQYFVPFGPHHLALLKVKKSYCFIHLIFSF
jgi:hypothetical protein